ncbi:TSUP family transporter [Larkinella soli]|uniref:TSUP family transporter n=1 Tax=Larkinella soli TaxID=1770527 RepID=UPI00286E2CE7|nr:TSUP family transporter [Larkinella soli]
MDILQVLGFLSSLLIGISLGLIGGGGSILTLPALVYLLGLNPVTSSAYSLFVVGTTSLVGSVHYIRTGRVSYRVALWFSVPSFTAAFLTRRYLVEAIPDPLLRYGNGWLSRDMALMVFFALVMLGAALTMIQSGRESRVPDRVRFRVTHLPVVLIGLLVGAVTGLTGVGGGFLIIPVLVLLARLPMKTAVGTSLLIIALKSLIGFLGDLPATRVNWFFLLPFTATSILGILAGTYFSRFVSGQSLSRAFGWFLALLSLFILSRETLISTAFGQHLPANRRPAPAPKPLWKAPDLREADLLPDAGLIRYGRDLIVNTARYLGPLGTIDRLSNGMNCQNCHLEAGTKAWGYNFGAVASTYPKYRERSGTKETIVKRVSDCFERSLNGRAPDSTGREMRALVAYIRFVGREVPKGVSPAGAGVRVPPYLDRAADPARGQRIYRRKCVACHGPDGRGVPGPDGAGFTFPPLWGPHSYNTGAGLYRLSRLAGYLQSNMPLGATWNSPQLTSGEAWDLAAFINSAPRPSRPFPQDWPVRRSKPVDHPVGPYADPFSERQHKYGPFQPIEDFRKKQEI